MEAPWWVPLTLSVGNDSPGADLYSVIVTNQPEYRDIYKARRTKAIIVSRPCSMESVLDVLQISVKALHKQASIATDPVRFVKDGFATFYSWEFDFKQGSDTQERLKRLSNEEYAADVWACAPAADWIELVHAPGKRRTN